MGERAIARGLSPIDHPLDEDSATRLLQGLVHPDDAPPGYGAVAGLLASAARLATIDEDVAATTVSAMVEVIRGGASRPAVSRRRSMLGKLLAGKALAAMAVVGLTASGAAAATGTLPDPVQDVVAGAVSHVGVDIPRPGDHGKSAGHRQAGAHRPDGDQSQAGDDGTPSTTAGAGDTAAGDHGQGQEISDLAHQTKADGGPVGPTVCTAASHDKCHAGQDHGKGSGSGDEGTTASTVGSGHDHGDAHGGVSDDHATTPTTGSIATGEDHSGRDVGSSGEGESGDHH